MGKTYNQLCPSKSKKAPKRSDIPDESGYPSSIYLPANTKGLGRCRQRKQYLISKDVGANKEF